MIEGYEETMALLRHPEVACCDLGGPSRLFVVGPSGVGKTTFARRLLEEPWGVSAHVRASGWIEERAALPGGLPREERTARLTEASLRELAADPDACARWVEGRMNCCGGGAVIDGVRNPRDFFRLFRPAWDYVVLLERAGIAPANPFEAGIAVIAGYALWCEANLRRGRRATFDDVVCKVSLDEVPS